MADIQNGFVPFSLVFIGEEKAICTQYSFMINNRGESGTASVRIPMENISSEVFTDDSINENIFEIEIWSGYLQADKDVNRQIKDIANLIENNKIPQTINKRFEGYVSQPEWSIGTGGKFLTLSCLDWSSFLRENKYDKNFEDGATEVKNIINALQKDVHGIIIKLEPYNGSVKMGEKDQESGKQVYSSTGKTFWDIIDECAKKLGYIVITQGKTIHITPKKYEPLIWDMYYGPKQFQEDSVGNSVGQYFDNLSFRYGAKGRVDKSEIIIELLGVNTLKSGKEKRVRIVYPEDKLKTATTKYIRQNIPGHCTESRLRVIAENIYKNESKRFMTGTLNLPFANQYIKPYDIMEFVIHKSEEELQFVNGYWVEVSSISEDFSTDGDGRFYQTIDFEANPELKNSFQKKVAPKYGDKK